MSRPIGSSTAENPNQPATDDQILGRINECIDYLMSANARGDKANVRAWANEIRALGAELRRAEEGFIPCEAHCWTYTFDDGPWMHCDDCGASHPDNPPLPGE